MVALEKKCPALNYKMNCSECPKVNHEWHIDRILQDLAKAKAEQDFENGKLVLVLKFQKIVLINILKNS